MISDETIAAISTPIGEGAIAIVRISGPQAISLANKLFLGKVSLSAVPSHSLHHGKIVNPRTGQLIDEVLVSVMKAPGTYTAEDMVEINCHGNLLITRNILELLLDIGARPATPGEFTRRAFLNGRIDLAEAEAVIDVIRSKADLSLKVALDQLKGGLSENCAEIRQDLIQALSVVEAGLDFSDQVLDLNNCDEVLPPLKRAEEIISRLLCGARFGQQLREGFLVVIVGRSNVGKSSLFNALLQANRAIVTDIPGTTRDTISEQVELEGIPIRLVDTAGFHASPSLVEEEGIRRTRQQIDSADLLLVLLDSSTALRKEDRWLLQETEKHTKLLVINKIDLPNILDIGKLKGLSVPQKKIRTSAKRGDGIEDLAKIIRETMMNGQGRDVTEPIVTGVRHQQALKTTLRNIRRARRKVKRGGEEELLAADLREALSTLGQITGETCNEEILEHIFSHFCVGK
jgi:tRNA modification GTPase